jgi:hypothetical protein
MTDSIRQKIITAIDTRLKTILIANDYQTNMGNHIFAWREEALQESELDGLIYKDRTESKVEGCGIDEMTMPVEIEIDSTSPELVRKCLADLEKAIAVDRTWGQLAIHTKLETSEMAVEQKEKSFAASKILMTVEYQTVMGDPLTGA